MTINEILDFLKAENIPCQFYGDETIEITGFSSLKNYKANTVTWAKNTRAYQYDFSEKLLVIVQEGLEISAKNIIVSGQSRLAFFSLIEYMADTTEKKKILCEGIGTGTVIGDQVRLGKNVVIGCNCTIDGDIFIGDSTRIWHNVTIINNVLIGEDCEIQSGCVIGHDGFAWNENARHEKTMIKHFGGVEIGDDVYIGPNCIVDRGEIDNTLIKSGAKLDADCFIAHNAVVGKNAILITGCRLYGSSELGDNAYLASAMIRNQCKVGKNAFIGMGAVVTQDIPADVVAVGVPARVSIGEE